MASLNLLHSFFASLSFNFFLVTFDSPLISFSAYLPPFCLIFVQATFGSPSTDHTSSLPHCLVFFALVIFAPFSVFCAPYLSLFFVISVLKVVGNNRLGSKEYVSALCLQSALQGHGLTKTKYLKRLQKLNQKIFPIILIILGQSFFHCQQSQRNRPKFLPG